MFARQNSIHSYVFPLESGQPEGLAFAGVAKPLSAVAVSRKLAVGTYPDSPQLFAMHSAVQGIAPQTLNLPFIPEQFGFVNLGKDSEEEFQAIGRLEDKFSKRNDLAFVVPISIDGHRRRYQIIEGDFRENAVMAGNGAAVVHKQAGRSVVSRRPTEVPRIFRLELSDLVEELLCKLDIGQMEAVAHYLQQPQFLVHSAYPGATADAYYDLAWAASIVVHPHVGGDRLERSRLLIEKLMEKFPKSQMAGNFLVSWHRDAA